MEHELTPSLENYLRVIYHVIESQGAVRAKEIATRLDVSNASVTGALRMLEKKNYIHYTPYGVITLTREGKRTGRDLQRARETLAEFLVDVLAVDEATAEEAACGMEHAVSRQIMDRFVAFFAFVKACPYAGIVWDEKNGFHCDARSGCCGTQMGKSQELTIPEGSALK